MNIITMSSVTWGGGAYSKLIDLMKCMLANNWKIVHISPKNFKDIDHHNLIHYSTRRIFKRPNFIEFAPQVTIKMVRIHRKMKIDYVIVFNVFDGVLGVFYKFISRNTRLFVFLHSDQLLLEMQRRRKNRNKYSLKLLSKIILIIEKFTLNHADIIISVSEELKNKVSKRAKIAPTKIRVMHNAIDPSWKIGEDINIKEKYGIADKKIMGFIGSLIELKGVNYLIKAFKEIKHKIPDTVLMIVGDGPERSNLEKLVYDLDIDDVIFTGWQEESLQYIKSSNLMVLPSLYEGSPVVILESFFCGTPIIGSRTGGIPEVLKYDELLFTLCNINEISLKIKKFFMDSTYHNRVLKLCSERRKEFEVDWCNKIKTILIEKCNKSN